MARPKHLIQIQGVPQARVACTPDWAGKSLTSDVDEVTCLSCIDTDFYKKKLKQQERECKK